MTPDELKERFESLLSASGTSLDALTPLAGLDLMLRLYREDADGGEWTCSWGVVTKYGGEEYGIQFTRWHAEAMLILAFKFAPRDKAGEFEDWSEGCKGPGDIARFRAAVESAPPFRAWGQSRPVGVALACADFESLFSQSLNDIWGVRDPSRPVVSMSKEQWLATDNASLMLRWLRDEWRGEEADLHRLLRRYYLSCCRRIWKILPMEDSRRCVEVAERHIEGRATDEEVRSAEWHAEGAQFCLIPPLRTPVTDEVARCIAQVEAIPPEELEELIGEAAQMPTLEILAGAALLVLLASCYPHIGPIDNIDTQFGTDMLSASLLREIVGEHVLRFML